MGEVKWTLSSDQPPEKDKMPHVPEIKATRDMGEGQKEFARIYNDMRSTLLANNLMNKK